ncbi:hypothetical protein CHLNCDRAFT_141286 [Chlorella variabilis]|uniref:Uncharacterized protein n=1 Tax=Chlorella variabilis TaxID=554065 RepID=E1ZSJ1_CHLVA|nr:hypothetical protein CHLNCDRAFT_141286 [Chlorella variabilis]EFN51255.1 hypothetical protein CHLNCDRAFT_141286 [Chlorella variabilis]|eukprot:XP_005843357.1 hypothetical protein CHLNCDRAFT_141286 [Chlorella variabilis]
MIGVGILGAANIANKNILGITLADNVQVVAVGSRDKAKAEAQLERCGLAGAVAAYGSYDEVVGDPRVDAVYITLPAALHLPWVRKAAAAGKHVLVEKPVAVDGVELDAMLAACADAGVQLMDGTMWSHSPRTERMAAILRDPAAVGELKAVTSAFTFYGKQIAAGAGDFLKNDVRVKKDCDPLGALGDLGWYCVRGILWAYGFEAPTSVTAHAGAAFNEEGVPLHIGATLLFSGGRRGHFECGFDRALTQSLEVAGTLGTIQLNDFVIPRSVKQSSFVVTGEHGLRDCDTWDATRRDEVVVHLAKPQEVCMWERFGGLVQHIQSGGQPDAFWPRITELTQRVLFAVERSAREGCREVRLSL